MNCRICGENAQGGNINFNNQPLIHGYCKSKELALDQSKHEHKLGYCGNCGFVYFHPTIDEKRLYENYFTISSWKPVPHLQRLLWLIECFSIGKDSNILEIGCNDGTFLDSLKNSGYNKLWGIEPTNDSAKIAIDKGYRVIHDFFSLEISQNQLTEKYFDLIVTRHVLEHIVNLGDFLAGVNCSLSDDGIFVIEIPDTSTNFENSDYCIWEEHCNFFTIVSLGNLLRRHGFSIIHYETLLFSGKALLVFCEKSEDIRDIIIDKSDIKKCEIFFNIWPAFKNDVQDWFMRHNNIFTMYGCGARSSLFINLFELKEFFDCFIDDQIEKQGLFVPGCGLQIRNARYLIDSKIKLIALGVNNENENKIINKYKDKGFHFCSFLPPSRFLPDFWKRSYCSL